MKLKMIALLLLVAMLATLFVSCVEEPEPEIPTTPPEDPNYITEGLAYELDESTSSYIVAGRGTAEDYYIVIPATHEGKPVTAIKDGAFREDSKLTGITIPQDLTKIGDYAFAGCTGMVSISLPDKLTHIGEFAFEHTGIKRVVLPDSLTVISKALFRSSSMSEITLGNGVTSIGERAFESCFLTTITIPVSVTDIGRDAFACNQQLTNVIYEGTMAQWETIGKNYIWTHDVPQEITVTCTDGTITVIYQQPDFSEDAPTP